MVSSTLRALHGEIVVTSQGDWKRRLAELASLLQRLSSAEVLALVFGDALQGRRLRPDAWRVDHLGFLARPAALLALPEAAQRAGFQDEQRVFESQLMARRLSGEAAPVPTQVFRASGWFGARTLAVEVFMPMVWADREIDRSVARGTGAHVALRTGNGDSFEYGERLLRAAQVSATRYELQQEQGHLRSLWVDTHSSLALQLEHAVSA